MKTVKVKEIQTSPVIKLCENEMLAVAVQTILAKRIHNIVIANKDESFSVLSIADILNSVSRQKWASTPISSLPKKPLKLMDGEKNTIVASMAMEESDEIFGVLDTNKALTGIVSYQDITDATELSAEELSSISLNSIVLRNSASTADYTDKLKDVLSDLNMSPTACLIVLKEGLPCGIITQRDIIRLLDAGKSLDEPLETYMTSPLFSVAGDIGVTMALQLMQKHHYRRVIVLNEKGFLAGVVPQKAIVRILYNYAAKEKWHTCAGLNEILKKEVEHRTQELRKHQEELEQQVQHRTQELLEANRLLYDVNNELAKERNLFQKYFNLVEASIVTLDSKGNITMLNRKACEILEYDFAELEGKNWFEMCLPQPVGMEVVYPVFKEIIAGKLEDSEYFENEIITRTGKRVLMAWHNNFFVNKEGNIEGIISAGEDISKKREAEEALALFNRDFEAFLNQTTDFIYFKDINSRFRFCSQTLADITGHAHWRDMIGKHDREVFPPDIAGIYEEEEMQVFSEGRPLLNKIDPYYDAAGQPGHVLTNKWPLFDVSGKIVGIFGISRDISERIQAEAALQKAKQIADDANRAKSTFLANMSHEIRTPMNAILGFLELLSQTPMDQEQTRYLTKTENAASTLLSLLSDILDITRIEAGKLTIASLPFKPQELFAQCLELFEAEARKKNLLLEYEVDENLPEYFHGDSERIRQVIINLVSNALKFTEKGSIHVALFMHYCNPERCSVEFVVSDTGIGIPKEKQSSLFDLFTQVDNSATREQGGSGLGLAICKQLVEAMGGIIEVESDSGEGATFSFTLSLEVPKASALPAQCEECEVEFRDLHILLAEDNDDNREVALKLMKKMGATVDEAVNGKIALEMIRSRVYDMVLMDIQMPIMDGLSAARALRDEGFTELPVIAISAHATVAEHQRSLAAGVNSHLNKPFKGKDIKNILLHYFPDKAVKRAASSFQEKCWVKEIASLPGLVLNDEICDYWLSKEDFLKKYEQFCHTILTESKRLHKMVGEDNISMAMQLLHKLKGSVKLYGAKRLFESIEQLQDAFSEEKSGTCSEAIAEYDAAVSEIAAPYNILSY